MRAVQPQKDLTHAVSPGANGVGELKGARGG